MMASERVQRRIDRLLDQIEDAVDQLYWATVGGVINEADNHRLTLKQAIKFAQETCRGLEFAHSRAYSL